MGRPSLLGTMARTAVIAGTAQAAAGSVAQAQAAKQQAAANEAAAKQATQAELGQLRSQVEQLQTAPAAPAPAPAGGDLMAQLQQLAAMKESGLLTETEFAAAKAKLLG